MRTSWLDSGPIELAPTRKSPCVDPRLQLHRIILNESRGHFDEHHIARDPAIVPPVELQCRHGIGPPDVAHFDDQKILAIFQQRSGLEVECREAAFVISQLFSVQIDGRR